MRLFQKILSHGLLIGFFVAVFFLYLYRVDLFPQWFGERAQTVATPSGTGTAERSAGQAEAPPAPELPPLAEAPPAAELPPVAEAPPAAEPPPVAEAPPAAELPPVAETAPAAELPPVAEAPPAPELPPVAEAPPAAELPPVAETPPAAEPPPVAEAPPAESTPQPAVAGAAAPRGLPQPAGGLAQPPVPRESEFPPARVAAGPEREAPVSWAAPAGGLPPADYRPVPETTSAPPAGAPGGPGRTVVQPEPGQVPTAPRYRPEPQRGSYPASQRWAAQQALQQGYRPMAGAAQPTAEVAARSQSSDYEQKLAAARSYFWRRDIGAAMQAYESLTTAYPNSAEAWGELGNVSFKLGHWSQAAEAYYHAVSLLIEGGETERAQHLLRVLHGLDADKAGELERRMRKPGG